MTRRRVGAWTRGDSIGRAISVVLALGGCNPPTRPRADAPVIIASTAPLWAAGKGGFVGDTPMVDIGGIGSPETAVRLSDGRIVVADGSPVGLRYFGSDGRPLYDVGRAGDAAVEIRSIYQLDRTRADTVVVYDLAQRSLFFFDPNGGLAHTVVLADSLTPQGSNGFLPKGITPDGRFVFQRDEVDVPFEGAPWTTLVDSTRLFWLTRQGSFTDSTARLVAGTLFGFELHAGNTSILSPLAEPLAPALRVVTGPDRVWAGDGTAWEITGYDDHGRPDRVLRVPGERTRLTPTLRDSFVASYRAKVAEFSPASIPRQLADRMGSAPFPERLPAYGELLAGEDSTLWAQHFGLRDGVQGDATLVWTVFGPDGRWLGDVTVPPDFRPTAVGHGWILGLGRAASGPPHVRLYPILER